MSLFGHRRQRGNIRRSEQMAAAARQLSRASTREGALLYYSSFGPMSNQMLAKELLEGFPHWLKDKENLAERTCKDHVGKVEKYLKDKEEFDDKGQLHKLSAIELARITEEHPGDKIRSVWHRWLKYLEYYGLLKNPQVKLRGELDAAEDESDTESHEQGDTDSCDSTEEDEARSSAARAPATALKTPNVKSQRDSLYKTSCQTTARMPRISFQPLGGKPGPDLASLVDQAGLSGKIPADVVKDVRKIWKFHEELEGVLSTVIECSKTKTSVEEKVPTTECLESGVVCKIENWHSVQPFWEALDKVCKIIELPHAAPQALDKLAGTTEKLKAIIRACNLEREVADQRMEALTLEFNTLTEEVKHLKQQRDQEDLLSNTPPPALTAKISKAKKYRDLEIPAAAEACRKATWQQTIIENVSEAVISRCECLIEELTKLIEAHPAQVEEIRQQALTGLGDFKAKVDELYSADIERLGFYLGEKKNHLKLLRDEFECYEVANIGSCFDLKPDIERYQKLIKELDKALSDKKKLKETIDGTAVDYGQLLEQMSTPALSLSDDEEALEGAETLQAFRVQASDRLHVRPAENSAETAMTESGHAETAMTSPRPAAARRSFLGNLLSPKKLFSPGSK